MKFTKKKTYYPFPVYEFNLPAGWTCPYAKGCLVKADRISGKQDILGDQFRCYASASERFPAVREARWKNFEDLRSGMKIEIPKDATHVRIHGSGDFYSQEYFDQWLEIIRKHPHIRFWAFTKSIRYWIKRIHEIPENFVLTASYGGREDELIEQFGLRSARVYDRIEDVPSGMLIDIDDTLAMMDGPSFALLNNFKVKNKSG